MFYSLGLLMGKKNPKSLKEYFFLLSIDMLSLVMFNVSFVWSCVFINCVLWVHFLWQYYEVLLAKGWKRSNFNSVAISPLAYHFHSLYTMLWNFHILTAFHVWIQALLKALLISSTLGSCFQRSNAGWTSHITFLLISAVGEKVFQDKRNRLFPWWFERVCWIPCTAACWRRGNVQLRRTTPCT